MVTATTKDVFGLYPNGCETWDALATPLDIRDVVIGEALWASTKSVFSGAAILIVAAALGQCGRLDGVVDPAGDAIDRPCFAAMALVVTAFARN
ncbi:MAG: hypothetical protein H6969_01160 [Gammaproteobacteria bacterium]|nr:hypothetical protein [Gammaproteobacteria bacterium]